MKENEAKVRQDLFLERLRELYEDLLRHRDSAKSAAKKREYNDDLDWLNGFTKKVKTMKPLIFINSEHELRTSLKKKFPSHIAIVAQKTAYSLLVILLGLLVAFSIRESRVQAITVAIVTIVIFAVVITYLKTHQPPQVIEIEHTKELEPAKA